MSEVITKMVVKSYVQAGMVDALKKRLENEESLSTTGKETAIETAQMINEKRDKMLA